MKKILAFLLSAAMIISCFAVASFAEDTLAAAGTCGEDISWSFDGETGTLTLSGKGATNNYYASVDAYTSTDYLSPFYNHSEIKKAVIENGITNIGDALFANCENLSEVVIPDSVVRIGKDVLLDTAIYKDTKNWDGKVFYYDNCILAVKENIKGEYAVKDNIKLIADESFAGCTALTAVTLNKELEYLGVGAFGGTGLETVTVPAGLKDTENNGARAFMDSSLQSIVFEDGAKFVSDSEFSGCTQLKSVKLPDSIEKIGRFAFSSCDSLKEFTVPEKVESLVGTFSLCKSLQTLNVPVSVKSISMVALPDSIKTINYAGTKTQWNKIDVDSSCQKVIENATVNYSVDFAPPKLNGLIKTDTGWKYFKNDKVDYTFKGLAKNAYGWWYISNGVIDYKYEGLADNQYGRWYVKNGTIDFKRKGMVKNGADWYYVVDGKVVSTTGLIKCEYGWWYIKKGKVDYEFEGLAKNQYGWWYIKNGNIDYNFVGLAKNQYGWWFIQNGGIDYKYKGLAKNAYGWWYVSNGTIDYKYEGLAKNQYGWWYVSNGRIDYDFKGLAKNDYGWWYIKKGTIDFTYNGTARNPYGRWNVVNGKATTKA